MSIGSSEFTTGSLTDVLCLIESDSVLHHRKVMSSLIALYIITH